MSDTDFWMYHDGLDDQARAFEAWAATAGSAYTWINNHHLTDPGGYPYYSRGAIVAINIRTGLLGWFDHLEKVLNGVATELRDVARESLENDLDDQALIDATDPQTYEGYRQSPSHGFQIAPEYDVVDSLLFPVYLPPSGGAEFYCDLGIYTHLNEIASSLVPDDLASPSEWVDTVLSWLGARTLDDQILQDFGGRWGDMRQFTDTLSGLSALTAEMRDSLTSAAGALSVYWQGFAANSAQAFFTDLMKALGEASGALGDAADSFGRYSKGFEEAAEVLSGQIFNFMNILIFAAIAAATGTATIETVVGGPIGYSAAGLALLRAYFILREIRDTLMGLEDIANAVSALDDVITVLTDFTDSIPVPEMVAH